MYFWNSCSLKIVNVKYISINCDWDDKLINLCILFVDITLLSTTNIFPCTSKSLCCSASYIICCLYANFEPSPNDLKRYAKYDDSQLIIQDGVHIVLKSLKYKLISDSLYQLLTKREKWIDIKNRFNLV